MLDFPLGGLTVPVGPIEFLVDALHSMESIGVHIGAPSNAFDGSNFISYRLKSLLVKDEISRNPKITKTMHMSWRRLGPTECQTGIASDRTSAKLKDSSFNLEIFKRTGFFWSLSFQEGICA